MAHLDLRLPGDLLAVAIDGRDLAVDESSALRRLPIAAYNLGEQGLRVSLTVRSRDRITGVLADFSNGLPEIAGLTIRDRSSEFMPAPFDFRDPTVVRTGVEF